MLDAIIKVLGTIALIIIAIVLFPFFIAALKWIIGIIAGFTFGGFLVVVLIALIVYLLWD